MEFTEILYYQATKKPIELTTVCINEHGIEPDEIFTIKDVIGGFEQLRIVNQYGQELIINPNQIL